MPKTPEQEIEEIQSQIVEHREAIKELKSRIKGLEKKAKEKSGGKVLTMDQAKSHKAQGG